MSEYTLERIEDFLQAANSDLGSTKYRPNVLITDYANCVTMGQQMLRNINAKDKRIAELEGCIREASSYLLSGHGVGHLAQPCLQEMLDKMKGYETNGKEKG